MMNRNGDWLEAGDEEVTSDWLQAGDEARVSDFGKWAW